MAAGDGDGDDGGTDHGNGVLSVDNSDEGEGTAVVTAESARGRGGASLHYLVNDPMA